jgi:hypothetical protein
MTLNCWDEIRMIPRLAIAHSFHVRQMDLRLRYRIIGVGILRVLGQPSFDRLRHNELLWLSSARRRLTYGRTRQCFRVFNFSKSLLERLLFCRRYGLGCSISTGFVSVAAALGGSFAGPIGTVKTGGASWLSTTGFLRKLAIRLSYLFC